MFGGTEEMADPQLRLTPLKYRTTAVHTQPSRFGCLSTTPVQLMKRYGASTRIRMRRLRIESVSILAVTVCGYV
jgi:hypothetical protein